MAFRDRANNPNPDEDDMHKEGDLVLWKNRSNATGMMKILHMYGESGGFIMVEYLNGRTEPFQTREIFIRSMSSLDVMECVCTR